MKKNKQGERQVEVWKASLRRWQLSKGLNEGRNNKYVCIDKELTGQKEQQDPEVWDGAMLGVQKQQKANKIT